MPALIAVKVNQAKNNTQKASVSKESKNSENSVKNAEGKEKVLNSDFKKILDKKISYKNKKTVKITVSEKNGIEKLKTAENKKLNPEKLTEKQTEAAAGMQIKSDELKADNLINFDADIKVKTAEEVKESADKNSTVLSASGLTVSQKNISKKAENKNEQEIKKITSAEKENEKRGSVKKESVKLQILDLRTKEGRQSDSENRFSGSEGNSEKLDLLSESSEQKTESSGNQFKEALFVKAEPGVDIKTETPVKSLTQQQTAVLEKLKADGNTEIVKQTKMILNDSNSGELRMVLKPERLGFVRIKLNLDDNNIVGRIIVDNNNIKEIFENNMDSLLKSFRESGFGSASLEVSVGGGKGQKQNMDGNERFFSKKIIEDVDSRNIVDRNSSMNAETIIDLVV